MSVEEVHDTATSSPAAAAMVSEKEVRDRSSRPITHAQVRALAQQLGFALGTGVYEEIIAYIDEHFDEFDAKRNVQWGDSDTEMVKRWFDVRMRGKSPARREAMREYVKNLVISLVVNASRLASMQARKTIKRSDMTVLLKFLDDVY